MSKPCWILFAAIALVFAVTLHAQDKAAAVQGNGNGLPSSGVPAESKIGGVVGAVITSYGSFSLAPVRGLPFSADTIYETDQFLADGNHIHSETRGKIFRDSEGRTRIETEVPFRGPAKVYIHISDPVENGFIDFNTEKKTAIVHHFGSASANEVKPLLQPMKPATAATAITPTAPAARVMPTKEQRAMHNPSEDLGTMEIEGFTVRGTRNTFTTPAGQVGNDKPMTNMTERWYSEDLNFELMNISKSPQSGTHVRKLLNIRTGDPDPLLFQVPADYTVQEEPQH